MRRITGLERGERMADDYAMWVARGAVRQWGCPAPPEPPARTGWKKRLGALIERHLTEITYIENVLAELADRGALTDSFTDGTEQRDLAMVMVLEQRAPEEYEAIMAEMAAEIAAE